jgi:hypothetical protein
MRCEECGKDFRRATMHQRFCSDDCRYAHHNREKRYAAEDAEREQYRREVLAHEARINGHTLIELVANPPPKLKGPTLGVRPLGAQPAKKEKEQPLASAVSDGGVA